MIELATVRVWKELDACIMEHIAGWTCRRTWLKECLDWRTFAGDKTEEIKNKAHQWEELNKGDFSQRFINHSLDCQYLRKDLYLDIFVF